MAGRFQFPNVTELGNSIPKSRVWEVKNSNFEVSFVSIYMHMPASVSICPMCAGICRSQKKLSELLELERGAVVSYQRWLLEIELGSS